MLVQSQTKETNLGRYSTESLSADLVLPIRIQLLIGCSRFSTK